LSRQYEYPYLLRGEGAISDEVIAAYEPFTTRVESLRALRNQLMWRWFDTGAERRALAIASAESGDGRSFLAANLAVVFSQQHQRTLLIDADLRDGKLHEYFALDRAAGLADCLAGMLQPYQAVRQGVAPHLDFIAAGGAGPYQAELLQPRLLSDVLRELGTRYDVVLVTAPPVLAAADALVVGASAGVVFLVARSGLTTEAHLGAAVKRLNHAGIAPHGVVFNDV
jgi:tyrosine-protein kinase Etk/Wzc